MDLLKEDCKMALLKESYDMTLLEKRLLGVMIVVKE